MICQRHFQRGIDRLGAGIRVEYIIKIAWNSLSAATTGQRAGVRTECRGVHLARLGTDGFGYFFTPVARLTHHMPADAS